MFRVEEYDRWFDSRTGRYIWSLEWPLIMEMLELKPGETLLDIGCGTGRLLQAVSCRKAVGLDQSQDMLSLAQEKGIESLVRGSAETLPFPDRSFDAVTLITVLEFVPDPEKVIREVFRVCKDRMVLGVLNRYSSLYLWKRIKGTFAKTSYKEACFQTVRALKHLIEPIAPGCSVEYKTTLVLRPIPGLGALFEQQLTKMGSPFGAFLVMRVSRES